MYPSSVRSILIFPIYQYVHHAVCNTPQQLHYLAVIVNSMHLHNPWKSPHKQLQPETRTSDIRTSKNQPGTTYENMNRVLASIAFHRMYLCLSNTVTASFLLASIERHSSIYRQRQNQDDSVITACHACVCLVLLTVLILTRLLTVSKSGLEMRLW